MIKVGQNIRLSITDVLEVECITKANIVVGNLNGIHYASKLVDVEKSIKDGVWEIIEDIPSVEEQLKELGWEIKKETNNIEFYRDFMRNNHLNVSYHKTTKSINITSINGNGWGINEVAGNCELKIINLILKYIEEN